MLRKLTAILISVLFVFEQAGFAQIAPQVPIPAYLQGLMTADRFRPVQLRYIKVDDASSFEVMVDRGDDADLEESSLKETSARLMRYFQIGLRLPNRDLWVNLRPDTAEKMIDPLLEKTDLGKVLLAADLQLKKDLAMMTSPDTAEGRQYWNKIYERAMALYGKSDAMDIPTITRPWIVPGEIIIRQTANSAYLYKASLKVMLEQDYIKDSPFYSFSDARAKALNDYATQLVRELILPKLTRQVNASRKYAELRQAYYSLVLAQWYKTRFQDKRIDGRDLSGLTSAQPWDKQEYYQAYKKSFEQGEYHKEDTVRLQGAAFIRQYVSGGLQIDTTQRDGGEEAPFGIVRGSAEERALLNKRAARMFRFNADGTASYDPAYDLSARDGGTEQFFAQLMGSLNDKVNGMSGDARAVADRARDWLVNAAVNSQLSETEVKALGEAFQRISDLRMQDYAAYEKGLVGYELKRAMVEGYISREKSAALTGQVDSFITSLLTAFGSRDNLRLSLDTVAEVFSVIPKTDPGQALAADHLAGPLTAIDSLVLRQENEDAREVGLRMQRWLVNGAFENSISPAELAEIAGVFRELAALELGSYGNYAYFLQEKVSTLVNQKILEGKIAAARADTVKDTISMLFHSLNGRFDGEYRYHDAVADVNFYARESGMDAASRDGGTAVPSYQITKALADFVLAAVALRYFQAQDTGTVRQMSDIVNTDEAKRILGGLIDEIVDYGNYEIYGLGFDKAWEAQHKDEIVESLRSHKDYYMETIEQFFGSHNFGGMVTRTIVRNAGQSAGWQAESMMFERDMLPVSRDGGDEVGGIDFRALPLPQMNAPGAAPLMDMKAIQALAANCRIKDVDKAWKAIDKDIAGKAVPYDQLKGLVALCCVKGSKEKIADISKRLEEIILIEEECAVATSAQMRELLQIIEVAA